jgi:hypothetical protein
MGYREGAKRMIYDYALYDWIHDTYSQYNGAQGTKSAASAEAREKHEAMCGAKTPVRRYSSACIVYWGFFFLYSPISFSEWKAPSTSSLSTSGCCSVNL